MVEVEIRYGNEEGACFHFAFFDLFHDGRGRTVDDSHAMSEDDDDVFRRYCTFGVFQVWVERVFDYLPCSIWYYVFCEGSVGRSRQVHSDVRNYSAAGLSVRVSDRLSLGREERIVRAFRLWLFDEGFEGHAHEAFFQRDLVSDGRRFVRRFDIHVRPGGGLFLSVRGHRFF